MAAPTPTLSAVAEAAPLSLLLLRVPPTIHAAALLKFPVLQVGSRQHTGMSVLSCWQEAKKVQLRVLLLLLWCCWHQLVLRGHSDAYRVEVWTC